ncbi:LLM class flavin-dependent oxidoreductase [Homoserinibacter sp. GY 40078]|uniref:LLM class flavin-dependent oxidoreductase n=1 Tax=Homoserinibacter sp. GY 40078 TaxID=2603275 RepID=UPI0011C88774|nr:LLM class flavin-dependent oxidoreductase [Homoserinibacter sp. GY 40078]
MTDYGHPIEFGTFITPVNAPPHQPVRMAQAAEQFGFDYASFQDHPYQPRFHDTWTLMAFTAAETSRIRLMGNVHNLPLRPPAVLARSVASLDLLTGGRIDLGIGSGGFWDAIEAMGGRRLTPGEGVTALSEAIDVIRGIWDAGNPERLVAGGEFHHVDGAKRGPRPAHDVPILVGAYKPRMLRLVGEKADGWVPSLGYLKAEDLTSANERIDDDARAAGRDPASVRRYLNVGNLPGDSAQQVGTLTALILGYGFSAFTIGGDDPAALERFAAEVAPAVREAVARERG